MQNFYLINNPKSRNAYLENEVLGVVSKCKCERYNIYNPITPPPYYEFMNIQVGKAKVELHNILLTSTNMKWMFLEPENNIAFIFL